MPVDADAYIAGAIPTLSRGGSWLPNNAAAGHSHNGSIHFHAPSHTHTHTNMNSVQRPAQSGYQQAQAHGHSHNFAPSNAWANPLYFHQAPYTRAFPDPTNRQRQQQSVLPPRSVSGTVISAGGSNSTSDGRKKEGLVGPVRHTGWLETSSHLSESNYTPSVVSRKSQLGGRTIPQPQTPPQSVHPFFDDHLPVEQGQSWEEQGGAPKPILPEPTYPLKREGYSDSKASSQSPSENASRRSVYSHPRQSPQPRSPYQRVVEILPDTHTHTPASPQARERSKNLSNADRDPHHSVDHRTSQRLHYHSFDSHILSPKPKKVTSDDLGRSAQLNSRLARLSLEGRRHRTPDPHGTPSFQGVNSPLNPNHTHLGKPAATASATAHGSGSGRPVLTRRHTSDNYGNEKVKSPSVTNTASSAAAAAVPPPHRAVEGLKRSRQLSSPNSSTKTHSHEGSLSFGSASPEDLTATATRTHMSAVPLTPSLSLSQKPKHSGRERRQSSLSIAASDSVSQQQRDINVRERYPSHESPSAGYVSPIADEGYDRYAAHPAAPAPDRADRNLYSYSSQASTPTPTPTRSSATGGGEYIPVGYARPTREIAWNRTGPAMKTHGIAWLRDGEVQSLPGTPQGPRWEIARPPRAEHVQGGSWWESGGEGSDVAGSPW